MRTVACSTHCSNAVKGGHWKYKIELQITDTSFCDSGLGRPGDPLVRALSRFSWSQRTLAARLRSTEWTRHRRRTRGTTRSRNSRICGTMSRLECETGRNPSRTVTDTRPQSVSSGQAPAPELYRDSGKARAKTLRVARRVRVVRVEVGAKLTQRPVRISMSPLSCIPVLKLRRSHFVHHGRICREAKRALHRVAYGSTKLIAVPFSHRWNQTITLPITYPSLQTSSRIAFTIWDIQGTGRAVPVGGTTMKLFGTKG